MGRRHSNFFLGRETAKGIAGGLLGAVIPNLASWRAADPAVIQAIGDVAVDLLPAVFLNALMSSLIAAVLTVWRTGACRSPAGRLPASLAALATLVLGLALGGTIATFGLIHVVASALALPGLDANGVMLVRAVQAVLVAAVLTPLTIVVLSGRSALGGSTQGRSQPSRPQRRRSPPSHHGAVQPEQDARNRTDTADPINDLGDQEDWERAGRKVSLSPDEVAWRLRPGSARFR